MDNEINSVHSCNICQKQFTRKFTLSRHKELCHGIILEKKFLCRSSRIKCTVCSDGFMKIFELIAHLKDKHNIELSVSEYEFDNRSEFEAWKESTELSTCSYYVKARNFNRKNLKTSYYDCHRSGFYERQGHKRAQKLKGTVRINGTCPARIKLVEDCVSGKHKVNFISTHVGHDNEAERLRLTKQERLELATKLQQGVSKQEILSTIKNNFSPTRRLSYVTRHDLNNITSAFNIKTEVKLNDDDAQSVTNWVRECRTGDFDPILAYKPIGETVTKYPFFGVNDLFLIFSNEEQLDFLMLFGNGIVLIDSTRQPNLLGIYISTLLVADETSDLVPVAFCFHTVQSEEVFKLFFSSLKEKVTILQPHTFISDENVSYNAWGSVFDFPEKKLLTAWYTKRAFDHIVTSKIVSADRRGEVRHLLYLLHEEVEEIDFEGTMTSALVQWLGNKETRKFGLHFQSKYTNRGKEWAVCYRNQRDKNVDVYYEKWREEIDKILKSSKVCNIRLDAAVNECVANARDRFLKIAVYQARGNLPVKLSLIRKCHKACMEMNTESVESVDHKKWIVSCYNNLNEGFCDTFHVELLADAPFICGSCGLVCDDCGVCVHALCCSCFDYCVKFTMCKHIHLVCQMHNLGNKNVETEMVEKVSGEEEILIIHLEHGNVQEEEKTVMYQESQNVDSDCNIEERRRQIHNEIDELHNLADRCSSLEQLNIFSRRYMSLRSAIEMVEICRIPFTELSSENMPC